MLCIAMVSKSDVLFFFKRATSLESYRSYLQYKFEGFHYAYIRSTELALLFLQKLLFRGPHRTCAVIRNNSQLTV